MGIKERKPVLDRLKSMPRVEKIEMGLDDINPETLPVEQEPNPETQTEELTDIIEDFGLDDPPSYNEPLDGIEAIIEDENYNKYLAQKLEAKAKRDQRLSEAKQRREKLNNPTITKENLEEAAKTILSALPPYTVKGITSYASGRRIPVWQVICGCANYVHQSVSLATIILDPSWLADNPVLEDETVCMYCLETFQPQYANQRFCSPECGRKDSLEKANISRLEQQEIALEERKKRIKLEEEEYAGN